MIKSVLNDKKISRVVFVCMIVCMISIMLTNESYAAESIDDWIQNGEIRYPIDTNSSEWKKLETHAEMVDVCTIPEELLQQMNTEELVKLVLEYPLLCDLMAYNSYQEGLAVMTQQFNGMKELLSREDKAIVLARAYAQNGNPENKKLIKAMNTLNVYTENGPDNLNKEQMESALDTASDEIMKNTALEIILGQKMISDELPSNQKSAIGSLSEKKSEKLNCINILTKTQQEKSTLEKVPLASSPTTIRIKLQKEVL